MRYVCRHRVTRKCLALGGFVPGQGLWGQKRDAYGRVINIESLEQLSEVLGIPSSDMVVEQFDDDTNA